MQLLMFDKELEDKNWLIQVFTFNLVQMHFVNIQSKWIQLPTINTTTTCDVFSAGEMFYLLD